MARRWVRLVIVLVALTTLGFTANRIRLTERVLNDEHNVERVFTDLSWALTLTLADLRAAEQAYVAVGQDRVYWTTKVNSHLDTVSDSLANLRRLATAPGSLEALGEAEGAIADLQGMDQRAREHASLEQPLLASDLIFTDGLALASRAAANIELARATERTTRNETVRTARSAQTTMLAVAAGVGVLMLLLLAPMPREKTTAFASLDESGGATERATPSNDDAAGLTRLDLTPRKRARTARGAAAVAGATRDRQAANGTAARKDSAEPKPDLRTAADLCTDLSAMAATEELPALLARAADLMNASGLIVWVLDATDALRPAIGHGYPPKALARIGAIPSDSSNATAAAYRDVRMQVVVGSGGASGALATPLRSANRCVGVLSAELRDGWESSDAVQASAAIVAAQLATMLQTDPPTESEAPAEAPPAEAHG
ncbi:MAG: hypothetical protein OSB03_01115 [Vicinamibacterales bacterium]|jgi:hypothetical protein|nr:hypothetical protein [Vicinamibacterales bacterium]